MNIHRSLFPLALCFASIAAPAQTLRSQVTPAAASAPTAIPALVPYSAVAFNSKGEPLTGETSVTFLIYKDESGGEPLWTESQTATFDSSGHYKVQLGAANPNGLPSDLFSTGEARWLEVQVSGQAEQPRVLLASVPYAMKAADATTLGGLPASAYALANTGSISPAGSVATVVTPNAVSNVTTTGGTADKLAKFSGTNTIVNSILYDNGTEVGIGTTAPTATLTVDGTFTVDGDSTFKDGLSLDPTGAATASKSYVSEPIRLYGSAYNSSTKAAVEPHFEWQVEPNGNNTSAPGAALSLLAGPTSSGAAETGFYINTGGIVHFATGQTFPGAGTGTITGVTAGTGLTGGGTSGNVTLNINAATVSSLAGNNTYTGSNVFQPSIYEDTDVNIDNNNTNPGNISPGLRFGNASGEGMSSKRTSGGNQYGLDLYTGYAARLSVSGGGQVSIGTGGTFGAGQLQVQTSGLDAVYGGTSYDAYEGAGVYGYASSAANGVIGQSEGGNGGEFFGGVSSGGAGQYGSYGLGGSSTGDQINGGYGVYGIGGGANGVASIGGHAGYFQGGYSSEYVGGFGGYFTGGNSGASGLGGYGIFVTGGQGSNNSGPDEGYSAIFQQNINVNGATVDIAHNVMIDDPADPANKYLVHSAVASSEQMNIYSGNVTTDELGNATVTLPSWFQSLNADFRYQLTVVDGRFAQAVVSKEIDHNQFKISTNATGVKVSWQVTAVRQDAYAKANPLVVEQTKGPRERGFYQHPELYGQPQEKQIQYGLHPELMAQLKAGRVPRPAPLMSSQVLKPAAKLATPVR